jgi:hypothetical protein
VYFSPSSPGAKVTAEQNPSEDVMSSVDPSLDLHWLAILGDIHALHVPCDISKGSEVQVANNAQRLLLLCIVDVDGILCRYRVNHSVRKSKGRCRPSWWWH